MGGLGSKSQSWEVTDDKKAAEEIPGAPTEHVAESQVKVVAAEPLNPEVEPDHLNHERGAEDQHKSDVIAQDDRVREETPEHPHHHGDASEHSHHHHDNAEHSHHHHHGDEEHSHHHHHGDEEHSHHHHHGDEENEHHHHHAELENDRNEAIAKPYEETPDEGVERVISGLEHASVHDDRDEEAPLVNVDIVWEHGGNVVLLVASFTEWQQFPLQSSDGVHKATFAVPRGRHTYKFIVDGEDRVDSSQEHDDGHNILHA